MLFLVVVMLHTWGSVSLEVRALLLLMLVVLYTCGSVSLEVEVVDGGVV